LFLHLSLYLYLYLSLRCPFVSSCLYVFVLYLCIYLFIYLPPVFNFCFLLPYSLLSTAFVFNSLYLPISIYFLLHFFLCPFSSGFLVFAN
jgi:hypothetical protein